jgi:hypothetical protein
MVLAGKLHFVHMDGRARAAACAERYVDRFVGVGLQSPFLELGLDCEEMGLEFLGGYSGITVRGYDGCIVRKCGYGCCWGGWKVRSIHEV